MQGEDCGVCGDSHEVGGQDGGGTVVRTYNQGGLLPLVMQFTRQRTFSVLVRICPLVGQKYFNSNQPIKTLPRCNICYRGLS